MNKKTILKSICLFSLALSLTACSETLSLLTSDGPASISTSKNATEPRLATGKAPPAIPSFPSQGAIPEGTGDSFGEDEDGEMALGAPSSFIDSFGGRKSAVAESEAPSAGADTATGGESRPEPAPPPGESISDSDTPEYSAGLLTAGEWNDHRNWPFWQKLMQDADWRGMIDLWGIDTTQRVQVEVWSETGPLGDVPVQLLNSSGKVLFEARTTSQGVANLFGQSSSGDFQAQQDNGGYTVVANLGEEKLTQENVSANGLEPVVLRTKTELAPAYNADVMLVVDTTGSMGDELDYLKSEMGNVAKRILEENGQDLSLRISTNFYRDLEDEYVVSPFPFSSDINAITQQLRAQSADGGGDFPEAVDYALVDAIDEHTWSPTARARLVFLVLDAPPHQDEATLSRIRTSIKRAAAKGIRLIPVASSGIDKETEFLLRMMAISTGGRYTFLTDDSGIGDSHIEPTVGDFKVEKLNDLMVRIVNEYISRGNATIPAAPEETQDQADTQDQEAQDQQDDQDPQNNQQ